MLYKIDYGSLKFTLIYKLYNRFFVVKMAKIVNIILFYSQFVRLLTRIFYLSQILNGNVKIGAPKYDLYFSY